jgi:hypothetical protein
MVKRGREKQKRNKDRNDKDDAITTKGTST